jgi:hypothetical protein
VTSLPLGCKLVFFGENYYRQELKSIQVSVTILVNLCWVKILKCELHDSYMQSPITATMPFSKTNITTINLNIVNSQYSPSCLNMNVVIIKYTKQQKETQSLSKKLQIITHLSTLQSGRVIPSHNANP